MSGPIVVSSVGVPNGLTQTTYRRLLGRRLARAYAVYTTTALPTTADRRRLVQIDRLIEGAAPTSAWSGRHLYVATGTQAGHQTSVLPETFVGSLGMLAVGRRFAQPLAAGSEVELSGSLPARQYGDWPCLNDCINEALGSLPIHLVVAVQAVSGQARYPLSALPRQFRRPDALEVLYPTPSLSEESVVHARRVRRTSWSIVYDGEAPYLDLVHGFGTGQTFSVVMRRPASTWIKSGGAWGASSVGLTDDTDEAVYDAETVVNVALPIAIERLEGYYRERADQAEADAWAARRATAGLGSVAARFYAGHRGDGIQRVGAI